MRARIDQPSTHHTMNPRTTPQIARHAILAIRGARYSSTAAVPESTSIAPETPSAQEEPLESESKVGQQIYVYHHLQKNNVVYSFNKALKVRMSSIPIGLHWCSNLLLQPNTNKQPPEHTRPRPNPLQRQKDRPQSAPKGSMAPPSNPHLPHRLSPNRSLHLPKTPRIPSSPRIRMGPRTIQERRGRKTHSFQGARSSPRRSKGKLHRRHRRGLESIIHEFRRGSWGGG